MKQISILFLIFSCLLCVGCSSHSKFILYNLSEKDVQLVYEKQSFIYVSYRDSLCYRWNETEKVLLPSGQGFVLGKGTFSQGVSYIEIDYSSLEASKNDSIVFSLPVGLHTIGIIHSTFPYYTIEDWNKLRERGYKFKLLNDTKEYKENPKRKKQKYEFFYPVIFIE